MHEASIQERLSPVASIKEACEYLSISRPTLRSLITAGKLAFIEVGKTRKVAWRELDDFLLRNEVLIDAEESEDE